MNNIWLLVLIVMIVGSLLKSLVYNPYLAVVIDLAVMGVAYVILRRYPYLDFKRSVIFLVAYTVVNILQDFGLISAFLGLIILLAVVAWMYFKRPGGPGNRPKLRHQWHK